MWGHGRHGCLKCHSWQDGGLMYFIYLPNFAALCLPLPPADVGKEGGDIWQDAAPSAGHHSRGGRPPSRAHRCSKHKPASPQREGSRKFWRWGPPRGERGSPSSRHLCATRRCFCLTCERWKWEFQPRSRARGDSGGFPGISKPVRPPRPRRPRRRSAEPRRSLAGGHPAGSRLGPPGLGAARVREAAPRPRRLSRRSAPPPPPSPAG